MKKRLLVATLLTIALLHFSSASLASQFNNVTTYINQYTAGELSAPQLLVYLEYTKNKMYEELEKEKRHSFTQEEIASVLNKGETTQHNQNNQQQGAEYEKRFKTNDFEVVFQAFPEYIRSTDYYEQRADSTEKKYRIEYNLVAIDASQDEGVSQEIQSIKQDIEKLLVSRNEQVYFATQEKLSKIKSAFWNIRNQETCSARAIEAGMIEQKKDYPSKEKRFSLIVAEQKGENCWNDAGTCQEVCKDENICSSGNQGSETCGNKCDTVEKCEDINGTNVCTNQQVCHQECTPAPESQNNCHTERRCNQDCGQGEKKCTEVMNGEIKLEVNCRTDGSDIMLNAWSNDKDFNYFQGLNEGNGWNCNNEIEKLVNVRKILQKGVNDEFVKWYFETFLTKDTDTILNGGNGMKKVMSLLIQNEGDIANRLSCAESKKWPVGFEKIDIAYKTDSVNFEVWEKNIPVEWSTEPYYTTLFKYGFIPNKKALGELIQYKLVQTDTFGPGAEEKAMIKKDQGKMEIIQRLSERYGGSFDARLELIDANKSVVFKYLTINKDTVLTITDTAPENIDVTVQIEYDTLYDFITYVGYTLEKDKISGPSWVQISDQEGLGKALGVLGAVSKMWREGVTIKPRYALLKMFFSAKDVIDFMKSQDQQDTANGETTKLTGNVIAIRE